MGKKKHDDFDCLKLTDLTYDLKKGRLEGLKSVLSARVFKIVGGLIAMALAAALILFYIT